MSSREKKLYEAEIDALERERALIRAQAAALKEEEKHQHRHHPEFDGRERMPLAYWIGWKILRDTRGSARLDLVRPRLPAVEPGNLFRRIAPTVPTDGFSRFGARPRGRRNVYQDDPSPLLGFGQGARIKIMRHIDFGLPDQTRRHRELARRRELERSRRLAEAYDERGALPTGRGVLSREPDLGAAVSSIGDALKDNLRPPEKPWFDFGAGFNLELDEGMLLPSVRLKVKDFFSIKLLPEPMFKIQKRFRLGLSPVGVRLNYELPLADAQNLWSPPARLMIRLDDSAGGLRLGPGGADFDEHVMQLGPSTVRAALSVDFPRTLPIEDGKLFGWRARRLGIKTRW